MNSKVCRFARIDVKINYLYSQFDQFSKGYESNGSPTMEITITEEDIQKERSGAENGDKFPSSYLETLVVYRKFCTLAIKQNVLLFHSSAICVDGEAYLFTAPSGTGKSTHAFFWRQLLGEKAIMVNDDKPLIRFNEEGKPIVYGTPWNGKHRLGANISCPIKAICLIKRGIENKITPISSFELLPNLLSQTFRPDGMEENILWIKNVQKLSNAVDLWQLECNPTIEAAKLSYSTMSGGEK